MLIAAFGLNDILAVFAHAAAGAIAANGLMGVAILTGQKSLVSPERRLPLDDDAKLVRALALFGAGVGVAIACLAATLGPVGTGSLIAVIVLAGLLGAVVPLNLATRFNDEYMRRALLCYEDGDYEGAFEDASEVVRSAAGRYPQAADIVEATREHRWSARLGSQPDGSPSEHRYAVH